MGDKVADLGKNPDKTDHKNNSADNRSASGDNVTTETSSVPPDSQNPQPPNHRNKYYRQCRERRENWKLGVEVATLLAIIVYAAIAALQWCALRAANSQSSKIFEATERPWIGLAGTEVLKAPSDTSLQILIDYENSGRSPAFQVWLKAFTLSPLDSAQEEQVNRDCAGKPNDAEVGALLLPGAHRQPTIYSEPLQSGTIEYIRERLGLKPTPTPPINLHPQGIILLGCIDYMWGNDCYRTRFCQQYVARPAPQRPFGFFDYCNFSNDTTENKNCKRASETAGGHAISPR